MTVSSFCPLTLITVVDATGVCRQLGLIGAVCTVCVCLLLAAAELSVTAGAFATSTVVL